jgi:hypothetical protein
VDTASVITHHPIVWDIRVIKKDIPNAPPDSASDQFFASSSISCVHQLEEVDQLPMLLLAPSFVEDYCTVILSSVPSPLSAQLADPLPKPVLCVHHLSSILAHWPRFCLNPLSLPPNCPGRHHLVPAVPPAANVYPRCPPITVSHSRSCYASLHLRRPEYGCHLASQPLDS